MEREHVTPAIHGQFLERKPDILNITAPADFSHLRWTLDYPEDYAVIRAVFEALYPKDPTFTWMEVLALMTEHPEMIHHNRRSERNEMALASLKEYLESIRG
jgi:spore coat polysaccharide biosynthesis protein SpsF (cytidylyltransferase family)